MGQSYFIWKNRDCRSMGVWMQGPAAIIRPEERVNHVEIPGRSGDLTETEGENIYNSYIQTVTIMVKGWSNVRKVFDWLRGSGYVTFSGEPDRRQPARVIGAITLNKHSHHADWWTGEAQFYCQPLKELLHPETVTVTSSGSTIRNMGDVKARPLMKVKASSTSFIVTVSGNGTPEGNAITLTGVTSNHIYEIDCKSMEIRDITDATNITSATKKSVGNFPVLAEGENTITGSGWSKIEIDKRERFL